MARSERTSNGCADAEKDDAGGKDGHHTAQGPVIGRRSHNAQTSGQGVVQHRPRIHGTFFFSFFAGSVTRVSFVVAVACRVRGVGWLVGEAGGKHMPVLKLCVPKLTKKHRAQ